MHTELSASPITVCAYSSLPVLFGVAVVFINPVFAIFSILIASQGLFSVLFWRVSLDDSGFHVSRRDRTEFIAFNQVKSVSVGLFGLPHLVLTLRPEAAAHRVRFAPERGHLSLFLGIFRLKRRLEDIVYSAQNSVPSTRAT